MKKVEQLGIKDQTEKDGKLTYEVYEDGLFTIVLDKETRKYFITVGKYSLSPAEFDTLEEAKNYIDSKPWKLIVQIAMIFVEGVKDINAKK